MSETDFTDQTMPATSAEAPPLAPPTFDPPAEASSAAARPAFIPEKFWDGGAGRVRVEDLAKSYRALERRLGRGPERPPGDDAGAAAERGSIDHAPDGRAAPEAGLDRADIADDTLPGAEQEDEIGGDSTETEIPDSPADYAVRVSHPWIERDADLDGMLHAAGFNHAQAQLVYDLAAERVAPVIEAIAAEYERRLSEAKLETHFGGRERYTAVARQVRAWGQRHLPKALFDQLSASPDGIVALHQMMRAGEPRFVSGDAAPSAPSQHELDALVRDPRYWRDHDADLVKRVEDGFRRLYPGT